MEQHQRGQGKVLYQAKGGQEDQENQEMILFETLSSTSTDGLLKLPKTTVSTSSTESSTLTPTGHRRFSKASSSTSFFFNVSPLKMTIFFAAFIFIFFGLSFFTVNLNRKVSSLEVKVDKVITALDVLTGKGSDARKLSENSTRHLLQKTRQALSSPTGVVISSAKGQENGCKNPVFSTRVPDHSDSPDINSFLVALCPNKSAKATFWRMEGHKFYTVDEALSPGHKNLFCLMTSNPLVFFLTVSVCNHGPNPKEQFTLTIEAVSVKEKKVLFAIRSKRRPDECVGLHKSAHHGELFLMETCKGQPNELFYLESVDYSAEIDMFKRLFWDELIK